MLGNIGNFKPVPILTSSDEKTKSLALKKGNKTEDAFVNAIAARFGEQQTTDLADVVNPLTTKGYQPTGSGNTIKASTTKDEKIKPGIFGGKGSNPAATYVLQIAPKQDKTGTIDFNQTTDAAKKNLFQPMGISDDHILRASTEAEAVKKAQELKAKGAQNVIVAPDSHGNEVLASNKQGKSQTEYHAELDGGKTMTGQSILGLTSDLANTGMNVMALVNGCYSGSLVKQQDEIKSGIAAPPPPPGQNLSLQA